MAQSGVPQYLGSPDDLKLLLDEGASIAKPCIMAIACKTATDSRFRDDGMSAQDCSQRLQGREFDLYYDRRDVGVLYIFVEGEYVGEAYCPEFMGGRVSEWEARAMRKHDEEQARIAREQGLPVRARIQDEAGAARRRRSTEIRQVNKPVNGIANAADIHPAEVTERLADIETKKLALPKLSESSPGC